MEVSYSSHFNKALKKLIKKDRRILLKFEKKLELFVKDPFHPSLSTHKLSGYLNGYWSFSVEYDLRIVFYFSSDSKVVFADMGSHKDVY
ncbi:MAG: type II toxin-antitoxin system YafQ family toxin [Cyclobacteriaceae bacterium]